MGTKSKKKAKTRLDAYYRLAKDQGFRARSAFKLIQLNRKYDFLAKSRVLVDLCAAPGGWCQVAAKHMPVGSKIVGVDLVPIAPIRGVKTFVGDITDDKTRKMVVTYLKKEPVDCVIHDGAPNVGGVWSRDLFEQNALVLHAAKMAASMLKPSGWFVTKVFRSQDFHKLMWVLKQLFEKVEATKPLASRMESAEIFVVCAGFKAPKHLDPSMFNAQKVFSDVGEEKILTPSGAFVVPKSNVPAGYSEFATVSHHVAAFSEFIHCTDPKEFLRSHHELRFAAAEDKAYLKSKYSKKELVYLCGDLQQVGDADIRRMLRWREQLLREQAAEQQQQGKNVDDEEEVGGADGDDDDGSVEEDSGNAGIDLDSAEGVARIARELLELRKKQSKLLKRKQKKIVDRKLKQIKGLINFDPNATAQDAAEAAGLMEDAEVNMQGEGEAGDGELDDGDDGEGFTVEKLATVDEALLARMFDKHWEEPDERLNDPLNPVMNANLNAEQDWDLGEAADGSSEASEGGSRPLQLVEGAEDAADVDNYGNYIPAKRSARVALYDEGLVPEDGEEVDAALQKRKAKDQQDLEDAGKQSKWLRHHVNVEKVLNQTFPKPRDNNNKKRKRLLEEDRVELTASAPLHESDIHGAGGAARKRTRFDDRVADDKDDDDQSVSSLSEGRFSDDHSELEVSAGRLDSRRKRAIIPDVGKLTTQELVRQQRKQTLKDNAATRKQNTRNKSSARKDEMGFEEIPVALTDPHIRARTLALATKMLDPKSRRDILDASINRYTFNDDDDLPDWFIKDEQRNCKVILPVTAEEIEVQRQRFRELNARPGKKVMEAVQRKRRRAQHLLRAMIEKGKADPRAREKANNASVRKLMRSQAVKGDGRRKKKGPLDAKKMGEMRRAKQRLKRRR
ncbi:putative FtsJ cell division protein [Trypanosoma conorhini]|uniref:Putative FtsJ cell division protein n=1 Tax=Trypanosoma conorhini TaxID=83891 RepID=A0A422QAS3_9TRYP|nr:putative FtsJ cell division protein [Trypanosoma conorhini]RNF27082.1 putative FtsJ cell division protein [Trypanosoma conorhini]